MTIGRKLLDLGNARVYGPNEYGEYTVRFYPYGTLNPNADYFTDDYEDAVGTANMEKSRMAEPS